MASYQPPTEKLPIFDNSVFSTSVTGSSVLTVGVANLLYLRKTFPDTATALETFSAGILTSSIDVQTTGSGLSLAVSSDSGVINLGTKALRSGAINIGTGAGGTSVITIGSSATVQSLNGSSTIANASSTNYDTTASSSNVDFCKSTGGGSITLAPNITSGNIYIGMPSTALNGRTGNIFIGSANVVSSSSLVSINNGTNNGSTTNIHSGLSSSGIVNINSGSTNSGQLNLMNGGSTSGSVSIMGGSTSNGAINIANGTGASQSTSVNISNGTTTGGVGIGNSACAVGINASVLTLGTATKTLTVNAPITFGYTPSSISGITQLGSRYAGVYPTTSIPASTPTNLWTTNAVIGEGIWLMIGQAYFNSGSSTVYLSFNNVSGTMGPFSEVYQSNGPNTFLNLTYITNTALDGLQQWYLVAYTGATASTVQYVRVNFYRIG